MGSKFMNELLLTPQWAISAGLRLNVSQGEDYLTYQQFDHNDNNSFIDTYTDFKQPISEILNVKFQNYFLQMPVGISYRFALNFPDVTILGNVGTDLNLAGKQYVTYEYSFDNAKFKEGSNPYSVKGLVFSNALFSIGLEKNTGITCFSLNHIFSRSSGNRFTNKTTQFSERNLTSCTNQETGNEKIAEVNLIFWVIKSMPPRQAKLRETCFPSPSTLVTASVR